MKYIYFYTTIKILLKISIDCNLQMLYYHIGLLLPLSQLQHDKEIIKRLGHALERERKHCSDYVFTNAAVAK